MQVYERVKKYINESGMKQGVIAERAGLSAQAMSAMMNGKRKMYADDLEELCRVLGVDVGLFIYPGNATDGPQ